jgi:hypothetical protein
MRLKEFIGIYDEYRIYNFAIQCLVDESDYDLLNPDYEEDYGYNFIESQ